MIDVRSDFVAGVEAVEVDVVVETLPGAALTRRSLNVGDDLVRGVRAAEIGSVPEGAHIVRATLRGRSGEELLSRRVAVQAHGVTGVVVALTRNCGGVTCPAVGGDPTATECQDGLCVPPSCGDGSCTMAECAADSECTPPSSICAEARCVEGVCLTASRIGACEPGFICVEGSGCIALPDAGMPDAGTPDSGRLDSGRPDTSVPDASCSGVCSPGQVDSNGCGNCGTHTRTCRSDCTWGGYSSCTDDDARCTGPGTECINDYCWGYQALEQSALSCLDMNRDYISGSASLGTLGEDVFGRPGATWTKENLHSSCAGATYADGESGTIGAGGTDQWSFEYGASPCTLDSLGHYSSRFRIRDTDGSTFYLAGTLEATARNSGCTSDRSTCTAAAGYCPSAGCTGVCTPGQVQNVNCGVCGTRSRTCASDCTWGSYSSCADTNARCTGTTNECVHDYCWGYRALYQSTLSCLDMNFDYMTSSASLGALGEDVFGRPGATWTKENLHSSCAGATYADGESGTIGAGGTDQWSFEYGASPCTLDSLGHYSSRFRIRDTDGSTFYLAGTLEATSLNSSCTSDRSTCTAAASFCP